MKLREKITRVLSATRMARGLDHIDFVLGLAMLAAAPVYALLFVGDILTHRWLYASAAAINVAMMVTMWGHAWRKAVDVPMGDAWYELPQIRRGMAGGCAAIGATFALDANWSWAAVMLVCALINWRGFGPGGGGWDDPIDAPHPDPSTSA